MTRSFSFLTVVLVGFFCLSGCGRSENLVIQPAADRQPTEQELKNEEALKAAALSPPTTTDPKQPGFSGN